jgi:alpha-galactosidase
MLKFAGRGIDLLPNGPDAARRSDARPPARTRTGGLVQLDYYYTKISESELKANLETLAPMREELGLEFFQLDDGYQAQIGDWLIPNEKISFGLAGEAETIAAAGFTPASGPRLFWRTPKAAWPRKHPIGCCATNAAERCAVRYNPLWDKLRAGKFSIRRTRRSGLSDRGSHIKAMGWKFSRSIFLYARPLSMRGDTIRSPRGRALCGAVWKRSAARSATTRSAGAAAARSARRWGSSMRCASVRTSRRAGPILCAGSTATIIASQRALPSANTTHRQFMHDRLWCNDPDCCWCAEQKQNDARG